jgi:hypothetical protein
MSLATACERFGRRSAEQFDTPQEAASALISAAATFDRSALKNILGSEGEALIETKDKVSDQKTAEAFAAQAKQQQRIEMDSSQTSAVLSVGPDNWPLPVPIVKQDGKWSFDAAAGKDEILRRRIGRNELDAIDVARGYVAAQKIYALTKHDSSEVNQYAQRVISTRGKHDGLAWQASDSTWQGPVGPTIARAIAEGYNEKDPPQPYHGYYFKILKGQGPAAPMGEMDFVVKGAMIGGFALVASPAEYMVTGVQTFIVSHDGIVYEKDLGDQTAQQFRTMDRYNPDSTWTPVATP